MLTIAWNPHGFHVIDVLPKGEVFSAAYYIRNILNPISALAAPNDSRRLIVHADNSRCHTAKIVLSFMAEKNLKVAPHPPYSPDLAPSDFYLFGYLKEQLRGCRFETADQLLSEVKRLLSEIPASQLLDVFHSWMNRCERVIEAEGDYIE
jgi:hypothetical protein